MSPAATVAAALLSPRLPPPPPPPPPLHTSAASCSFTAATSWPEVGRQGRRCGSCDQHASASDLGGKKAVGKRGKKG